MSFANISSDDIRWDELIVIGQSRVNTDGTGYVNMTIGGYTHRITIQEARSLTLALRILFKEIP